MLLRALLLFTAPIWAWQHMKKNRVQRGNAVCRNHDGDEVDWWFILEASGDSKRYIYFDSKMAQVSDVTGKAPRFMPLDDRYRLDDPDTSPLIKTLYSSQPLHDLKNKDDNTIMIAINDQRGAEGTADYDPAALEKILRKVAKQANDPNAEMIRVDKGKDIFGHPITSRHGHAKYVFTSQVVPQTKKDQVLVRSYLISHSLPRFPNFTTHLDGTMTLPLIKSNVFSSNALTASAKGQHFFCKSFEEIEILDDDGQLAYDKEKLTTYLEQGRHLVAVYHLFKTINGAVVFSNYYNKMQSQIMKIYHKLFDPRKVWSNKRDFSSLVQGDQRLYPIGPVKAALRRSNCSTCDFDGACDASCVSSFELTTTNKHYSLTFNTVYHDGIAKMDMFDDLIAPQVIPKELYTQDLQRGHQLKYFVDALIVQSWMDHTTLANNMRELITRDDGKAAMSKVWIANSLSLRFPVHKDTQTSDKYLRLQSFGTNHSKIAFSVPLHGVGNREPLFCFADKNRTLTQRGRPDERHGRGGGAWCTRSAILSTLMLSLHPAIVNNEVGNGVPVSRILHHLPNSKASDRFAIMQYDQSKTRVRLAIPSRAQDSASYVCECRHPFVNIVEPNAYYRPESRLFAFQEPASDASSEDESTSSDDTSGSDADVQDHKRKRSDPPVSVKVSRPRCLHDFGSPVKLGKDHGTPQKFNAKLAPHPTGLFSPEHHQVDGNYAKVGIRETLRLKLFGSLSPATFKKLYAELDREDDLRLPKPPSAGRLNFSD